MVAAADAKYKVAMEQATGDHDIAMKQCEALAGDQQKACKDRASADLAAAQARADEDHAHTRPSRSTSPGGEPQMKQEQPPSKLKAVSVAALFAAAGCASTQNQQAPGEYVDDALSLAKSKAH